MVGKTGAEHLATMALFYNDVHPMGKKPEEKCPNKAHPRRLSG